MDGTGETAAQRVTDLEAQLAAAREAAAAEAAAGAAPGEQQAAATDAAAQAGANDAQAAQAGAQAVAEQGNATSAAAPGAPVVAPGDGTRPQEGIAPGTAEGTGAIQAAVPPNPSGAVPAVPAAEGTAGDQPPSVIDLVKQAHDEAVQAGEGAQPGQHHFVEVLRHVAGRLVEDGRIVEADLLTPTESGRVHATLIKLVGELLGRVL